MKLRTIAEIQYKAGPRTSSVSSATGKYNRGSVNDLSSTKKSKKKQKSKEPDLDELPTKR